MKKLLKYIKNPVEVIIKVNDMGFKLLPDKIYIKILFMYKTGYRPNLRNPETYNEKCNWLKLYDRKPEYTKMVDKYIAKNYIIDKVGKEYAVPLLGVWDSFDKIDFNCLPNQFVLKTTNDSGSVVICKDKEKNHYVAAKWKMDDFDLKYVKRVLSKSLKKNYFYHAREWPYKNIKPRIIAEKYIDGVFKDYKLFCFSGKVKCTYVTVGASRGENIRYTFFDNNWQRIPFTLIYPSDEKLIERPKNFNKMIELAETISDGIPFLRVDFFEVNDEIYIGELTFYSEAGFGKFDPFEYDKLLGSWIKLPERSIK